jgi:hypothetical protein
MHAQAQPQRTLACVSALNSPKTENEPATNKPTPLQKIKPSQSVRAAALRARFKANLVENRNEENG